MPADVGTTPHALSVTKILLALILLNQIPMAEAQAISTADNLSVPHLICVGSANGFEGVPRIAPIHCILALAAQVRKCPTQGIRRRFRAGISAQHQVPRRSQVPTKPQVPRRLQVQFPCIFLAGSVQVPGPGSVRVSGFRGLKYCANSTHHANIRCRWTRGTTQTQGVSDGLDLP